MDSSDSNFHLKNEPGVVHGTMESIQKPTFYPFTLLIPDSSSTTLSKVSRFTKLMVRSAQVNVAPF